MSNAFTRATHELRVHAPFTVLGTLTGVGILLVMVSTRVPSSFSQGLFPVFHALHVLFSAITTTALYRLRGSNASIGMAVFVGYVGSVGIATVSDCLIPYAGEYLVDLPHAHAHVGFIEEWWLINPMAIAGIAIALYRPATKLPHFGHVLLSTWASLFHVTMAMGDVTGVATILLISLFLFLAVWIPCCTSDIVFPMLLATGPHHGHAEHTETACERGRGA